MYCTFMSINFVCQLNNEQQWNPQKLVFSEYCLNHSIQFLLKFTGQKILNKLILKKKIVVEISSVLNRIALEL